MDGTITTTTLHQHQQVKRSGNIGALFVLVVVAVGLHVALFAALETVAPLGVDVAGETSFAIPSARQVEAVPIDDAELEHVIADAR